MELESFECRDFVLNEFILFGFDGRVSRLIPGYGICSKEDKETRDGNNRKAYTCIPLKLPGQRNPMVVDCHSNCSGMAEHLQMALLQLPTSQKRSSAALKTIYLPYGR